MYLFCVCVQASEFFQNSPMPDPPTKMRALLMQLQKSTVTSDFLSVDSQIGLLQNVNECAKEAIPEHLKPIACQELCTHKGELWGVEFTQCEALQGMRYMVLQERFFIPGCFSSLPGKNPSWKVASAVKRHLEKCSDLYSLFSARQSCFRSESLSIREYCQNKLESVKPEETEENYHVQTRLRRASKREARVLEEQRSPNPRPSQRRMSAQSLPYDPQS